MTRDELLATLVAERFGTVRPREATRRPLPLDVSEAELVADTDIAIARRRRVLCDALDDAPPRSRRVVAA